jgi:hypothetical protein
MGQLPVEIKRPVAQQPAHAVSVEVHHQHDAGGCARSSGAPAVQLVRLRPNLRCNRHAVPWADQVTNGINWWLIGLRMVSPEVYHALMWRARRGRRK